MELKLGLPIALQEEIQQLEDKPGYINKKQLAKACGVRMGTLDNWNRSRDDLPMYDCKEGIKVYWLPETIADFIYNYRKNNNKPLA